MEERAVRIAALGWDYASEPKERAQRCNLCGTRRRVTVSHRDRYGFPVRLAVCCSCGLGYIDPRMTAEAYGRFYAEVHRRLQSAYWGKRIDEETIQSKQVEYARRLWNFLGPRLKIAYIDRILDIGGSTGVVSRVLRDSMRGYADVTVLDPAPLELVVAERQGLGIALGSLEEFTPEGRRWNLILLCQTIDHLLDVRGGLEKIREMVAPAGYFYFDIVDWAYMRHRAGRLTESVKVDHTYYLTRETAIALAELAGFCVEAEEVSPDGKLIGFLCTPAAKREVDREEMKLHAEETLRDVRMVQALSPEHKLYWERRKT